MHMTPFALSLKGPADFPAKPIESRRPGSLQPLHPVTQIRLEQLHGEMKVIPHDHIRMQPPTETHGRLDQAPLKRLRRALARKQIPPVVPPIDHMITRSRVFQSELPCHAGKQAPATPFCQESTHDPFFLIYFIKKITGTNARLTIPLIQKGQSLFHKIEEPRAQTKCRLATITDNIIYNNIDICMTTHRPL